MKSSFFNFERAFILVLHQESVSFQMWQTSGIFFLLFNRYPFLFNNRCQFCSELLLFFSFISSFLSLSFAYHPLHPPLSISPSLTRLSSETLLSIDGAVALCSLLQPLASPPFPPNGCLWSVAGVPAEPGQPSSRLERRGFSENWVFRICIFLLILEKDGGAGWGGGGRWRLNWICKYV